MKQHINDQQINELSGNAKDTLRVWWEPTDGDFVRFGSDLQWEIVLCDDTWDKFDSETKHMNEEYENAEGFPLLSIGQMIDFLGENVVKPIEISQIGVIVNKPKEMWHVRCHYKNYNTLQLCDALWEAVKEVLEKP